MKDNRQVVVLNLDDILPNRFQPRIKFDEKAIVELSESIKEHGVIQPIIVRKIDDKFEIIAGERRYKASVMAGKTTIPAIVVDLNDKESSEIALIENVQRKDLTPIEEAISYRKIFDMGNITQEELAAKLGVSQSTIANKMRLLNLDDEVQDALLDEKISERHARSLLKLSKMSEQREMLKRIITERLTVRRTDEEIEKIIKGNNNMDIMDSFNNKVEEPIQNNINNNEGNNNPFNINGAFNQAVTNTSTENYNSNVNNIEVFDFADFGENNQNVNQPINNVQDINMPQSPIFEDNNTSSFVPNPIPNDLVMNNTGMRNDNFTNNINQNVTNNVMPQMPIVDDTIPDITKQDTFANPFVATQDVVSQSNVNEQEFGMPEAPNMQDNEFQKVVNDEDDNDKTITMEPININNQNMEFNTFSNNQDSTTNSLDNENDVQDEPEIKQGRFFNILSNDVDDETSTNNQEEMSFNGFNNQMTDNNINNANNNLPNNEYMVNQEETNNNIFNSFGNFGSIDTQVNNQVNNQVNEIPNQVNFDNNIPNNTFDYNSTPVEPVYDDFNEEPENNYNNNVNTTETVVSEPTLKDIISMVRNCADDIEKQGFELDSEEFDFQDIYQVIFKIKKK